MPGYAELVYMVKSTTVAAMEDQREEAEAYYEAKFAKFGYHRRQHMKKDDKIRNFLI